MNENTKHRLSVEVDSDTYKALQERIVYLQARRPGSKVSISDAVRHALTHTGYKRNNKKSTEEE